MQNETEKHCWTQVAHLGKNFKKNFFFGIKNRERVLIALSSYTYVIDWTYVCKLISLFYGISAMIAARFLCRSRIYEVECILRFASALPKALPTANELTTPSDGLKRSAFAPPSSAADKNKPLRLPQIINLSENAVKEAKRTKEWRRMEPNGLIKVYLQVGFLGFF